nr:hypothetical protein [Tanacetum cinerariifolium]
MNEKVSPAREDLMKSIDASNYNEEKEEPSQDSNIHQLIEECRINVYEEQKQSMEDTMIELVKICQEKEFLCIHDNVEDLIESALNSKLLSINSQRLEKEQQEVKNVVEYECEVTLEDKRECDVPISENSPICDNHSETFSDSKIDDDILVYDDDFEDIEYVEASLFDPEIVSLVEENGLEEENVVHQEEENDVKEKEIDLEYISQIQDVVLHEKLLSITQFETFCYHTEETRSGNTTTHADNSFPEYDSFCFEIESDQERLINVVKSNISDNLPSDPLLEEADLFHASDNSIPPGIENFADNSKGDVRFLEELLINDSILSHESSDSNFEDNPSIPQPPPEPPDAKTDGGKEISVVMNDKDKFDEDFHFFMFDKVFSLLSNESEDTIFDPGISA